AHAHDCAGTWSRPAGRRAHLERVQLAAVEGESEHLLEPGGANLELRVVAERVDVFVRHRSVLWSEHAEVRDVDRAVAISVAVVAMLPLAAAGPSIALMAVVPGVVRIAKDERGRDDVSHLGRDVYHPADR